MIRIERDSVLALLTGRRRHWADMSAAELAIEMMVMRELGATVIDAIDSGPANGPHGPDMGQSIANASNYASPLFPGAPSRPPVPPVPGVPGLSSGAALPPSPPLPMISPLPPPPSSPAPRSQTTSRTSHRRITTRRSPSSGDRRAVRQHAIVRRIPGALRENGVTVRPQVC